MRRLLPVLLLLVPFAPARAEAVTIRDIVELSRAGLGEDVLLALIEVDPRVFSIDAATLKSLKDAGVSQKVIIAMIRSGRTPPPTPQETVAAPLPTPEPVPHVIVIDHHDQPAVREVAVPVYVPVFGTRGRVVEVAAPASMGTRFIPTTGLSAPPPVPSTAAPGSAPSARPRLEVTEPPRKPDRKQ